MSEFRLIVAGGREFTDRTRMAQALSEIALEHLDDRDITFVSGMARGADMTAHTLVTESGYKCREFPADWDKYGKSAGYKRNTQMAENADGLVAFWDGKSRGTKHMIDIANRMGLQVWVINY